MINKTVRRKSYATGSICSLSFMHFVLVFVGHRGSVSQPTALVLSELTSGSDTSNMMLLERSVVV